MAAAAVAAAALVNPVPAGFSDATGGIALKAPSCIKGKEKKTLKRWQINMWSRVLPRKLSAILTTIVDFPSNMHEAYTSYSSKDYLRALRQTHS